MQPLSLLALLFLPLLALAQSSNNNAQVITSLSTGIVFVSGASGRQESTTVATILQTITNAASGTSSGSAQPTASGNSTRSGNQTTAAASGTASGNVSTIPYSMLPTAPTSVDGGGINGGAPSPGATGAGGIYGPDDGYISGVLGTHVNTVLLSLVGVVIGGAYVLA
ncbi:hypothetical protein OE88DRAFT_114594 [Heliocybe sulcata]|uniref:Uncharacterized protein n=1 Tax=Heliocybe sulcata TaxID=5364 RepID=A0A5C3NK80_9AGAM|nr:hypothetical protein OE88DRAFT_114594 [Heliocybe sulcata]